jgi:polar amino acid transport system permease protein
MKLIDTFFNLRILSEALPALLRGLLLTLELGVVSALFGTLLGVLIALLGLYGPGWLRGLVRVYIDVLRSMPLLVFMVLIYYALPFVKVLLPAFTSAVLAIAPGQFEAARSLGLRSWDVMKSVIMPQALRIVVPPLTGNAVSIMKDTATASVVALPELLQQATSRQALAANPTPLIGAAIIYIVLLFPLVRLVSRYENRAKNRAAGR